MLTLWVDERVRSLSHRGAVSYYSAGSIALENANDAGEVACNKPEAQAKGIERYVFSNNLRLRFRLVSPELRSSAVVFVNCRGPLSMPRAEVGIHGLNR